MIAGAIEPLMPSESSIDRSELPSLVLELERKASRLEGKVSPVTAVVLEDHMRVINSYYSNLIEGNSTHPYEIKQAMSGSYSSDPAKRDLQKESLAHIHVQKILSQEPFGTEEFLKQPCLQFIHSEFYSKIPRNLRLVSRENGDQLEVVPGVYRTDDQDVKVGVHIPPPAFELNTYMDRFEEAYRLNRLFGLKRVIAAMASHHRFTWIHPFLDGNGRVARLHTDFFLKIIGLGACGIWCLSRGLAKHNEEYKAGLARADQLRKGDTDGRGILSEINLVSFCEFMVKTALDQVEYMDGILELQDMCRRIQAYVDDRVKGLVPGKKLKLKPEAARLLEKAFILGEFERGDMAKIAGLGDSSTRKLVQQMKEEGLLTETSSRSPLRWAIPNHAERYYLPGLSPAFPL